MQAHERLEQVPAARRLRLAGRERGEISLEQLRELCPAGVGAQQLFERVDRRRVAGLLDERLTIEGLGVPRIVQHEIAQRRRAQQGVRRRDPLPAFPSVSKASASPMASPVSA